MAVNNLISFPPKDVSHTPSSKKITSPITESSKAKQTKGKTQGKFVVVSKSTNSAATTDTVPKQPSIEEEVDSLDDLPHSEI